MPRVVVTGLSVLVLALAGCTSGTGAAPATSTTGASAPTPADPTTSQEPSTEPSTGPGSPSGTPAPALPNPAPTSIGKVTRSGAPSTPTASAASVPFAAPATYPDGVAVTVVKAAKAVETGQGPGVFNGRELIVVDLEISNGSTSPITLNQVVITTFYGLNRQVAPAVYPGNIEVKDFAGTTPPGGKATARYAFAVPATQVSVVTMNIDFDDSHASAIFTGAVTT